MASERAVAWWAACTNPEDYNADTLKMFDAGYVACHDEFYNKALSEAEFVELVRTETRATTLGAAAALLESCAKDHDKDISEVGLVNAGTLRNIKRKILALTDAEVRELLAAHDKEIADKVYEDVIAVGYKAIADMHPTGGLNVTLHTFVERVRAAKSRAALGGE